MYASEGDGSINSWLACTPKFEEVNELKLGGRNTFISG